MKLEFRLKVVRMFRKYKQKNKCWHLNLNLVWVSVHPWILGNKLSPIHDLQFWKNSFCRRSTEVNTVNQCQEVHVFFKSLSFWTLSLCYCAACRRGSVPSVTSVELTMLHPPFWLQFIETLNNRRKLTSHFGPIRSLPAPSSPLLFFFFFPVPIWECRVSLPYSITWPDSISSF